MMVEVDEPSQIGHGRKCPYFPHDPLDVIFWRKLKETKQMRVDYFVLNDELVYPIVATTSSINSVVVKIQEMIKLFQQFQSSNIPFPAISFH
jgi:hypothetical protein